MKLKDEKRYCVYCTKEYVPKYKPQKYCSRHCSMLVRGAQKSLNKTKTVICNCCNKEFIKRISALGKYENYCSTNCFIVTKRGFIEKYIEKTCACCNEMFKCLNKKQTKYCSKSCSMTGNNNPRYGKVGTMKGKSSWTKGLNKKTDERIAKIAEKVSKTHKELYSKGLRDVSGSKNPNYGKTVKDRTIEQLEKYSAAATNRILNGMIKIRGFIVSRKTGKTYKYRSSFEKRYIECLEKDSNVIHYDVEPFVIPYKDKNNRNRKYIPDLYVCYSSGEKSVIEIKCDYTEKVYNFPEKKQYAIQWCQERNYKFIVCKEKEIIEYEESFLI